MRILLLTPQLPDPPHQGTALRNINIVRGLAERHEVTLLSVAEAGQVVTERLRALCSAVYSVPGPARTMQDRLRTLLLSRQPDLSARLADPSLRVHLVQLLNEGAFDVVQVEGLEMAHLIPYIIHHAPRAIRVYDAHNAETALQQRAMMADLKRPGRWGAAVYSSVQVGRLRHYERRTLLRAQAVTAVSEIDAGRLTQLTHGVRPYVIPNCIDVAAFGDNIAPPIANDIVFSGKMDYRPNVDAVLWFAAEIWPRLKAAVPSLTWAVVGQKPHRRLASLGKLPGVTVTGRVAEIGPYLAGAKVVVLPFRVGGGTRLKLIEALAAGRAVVSTAVGAEGFPVTDGREVRLADTPVAFAAAVGELLEQPEQRRRLGAAGRALAQAYDWRVVVPRFDEVYADVFESAKRLSR